MVYSKENILVPIKDIARKQQKKAVPAGPPERVQSTAGTDLFYSGHLSLPNHIVRAHLMHKVTGPAQLYQRADFSLWLSRQGLPKEGLTLITAQEAADDLSAFLARTDALARLSNWQSVLETTETAEKVPDSMRQLKP